MRNVLSQASRPRLIAGGVGIAVLVAGVVMAVVLARSGPTSERPSSDQPAAVPAASAALASVAPPALCERSGCTRTSTHSFGGGYAITLWHVGPPNDYATRPVLELSNDGAAVQWVSLSQGYGWAATMTCAPSQPQCIVLDQAGAHSGTAQTVRLTDFRLQADAGGAATFDLPDMSVRDLDGDGNLDVAGVVSDYTPNFAQGHLYWDTLVERSGKLVSTGCAPRTSASEPAPQQVLAGTCPPR